MVVSRELNGFIVVEYVWLEVYRVNCHDEHEVFMHQASCTQELPTSFLSGVDTRIVQPNRVTWPAQILPLQENEG